MEQEKHTPIPWRYQTEVELSPGMPRITRAQIYTASGKFGHPATCDRAEDAEFITRACNAHYELLEALEIRRMADAWKKGDDLGPIERRCRALGYRGLESGDGKFLWEFINELCDAAISNAADKKAVAS